jgi:hypothetical protein
VEARAWKEQGVFKRGGDALTGHETVQVEGLVSLALAPQAEGGADFVDAARLHVGHVIVGPSAKDKRVKVEGWNFSSAVPAVVLTHPRQSDNVEEGWSDQFAIQVVETSTTSVLLRIRRVDVSGGSKGAGWGQDLRIDLFVVDVYAGNHNPDH